MTTRLVPLLCVIPLALPATAEEPCPRRAHVDCAGAMRAVEAAVAADPWLALLDRARAMRLAELAAPLGEEAAAELRAQDAAWRRSLPRADGSPVPFCGAAGSVAGAYFRVGAADWMRAASGGRAAARRQNPAQARR